MKRPPAQLFLPEWFAKQVCLIGQGAKTCRYLTFGENGFSCAKLISSLRMAIDQRKKSFLAKGDNCPGTPMVNPDSIRGN